MRLVGLVIELLLMPIYSLARACIYTLSLIPGVNVLVDSQGAHDSVSRWAGDILGI